jgi:hypothetical protein
MLSNADEIRKALDASVLADRDVQRVPIPGTAEVGFELNIGDLDAVAAWHAAREALRRTGRWPLLVDVVGEDVYSGHFYPNTGDQSPAAIIERAGSISWPDGRRRPEFPPEDWERVVGGEAVTTKRRNGQAPSVTELLEQVSTPDWHALDAFLLAWEEDQRPTTGREYGGPPDLPWGLTQVSRLVLLPSDCPSVVPAYTHFWGAGGNGGGSERLVSALRSWHHRYGAEPCAATGVTLTFAVRRPPTELRDAWQLVTEMESFIKLDDSIRERARSLLGYEWWELYDRP